MPPPTIITEAPRSIILGAVSAVIPPATASGMLIVSATSDTMSSGEPSPFICSSIPTWRQTYEAPSSSTRFALFTLSGTLIMSTMTAAPYFRAASTDSETVPSSDSPNTVMTSAPALAAISTSNAPTSMVFMSATSVLPGNSLLRARRHSAPSLLIRGVPASIQSAPPSRDSRAISSARFRCMRSRATCRTGCMNGLSPPDY
jgi:hypothetical protein